ncbi:putative ankyrin repeat domain protein [Eutypa lata UCREL1]|uniref:Putative ankyrin repeat domain protein n=1 Tax=Eutypa lata (strain UCR-EL1) TaxID=1287681 RepID=M7SCK5_EUTLA|nr:putative ankyrin repeat domain protein [Eutypa lata UCREL1]
MTENLSLPDVKVEDTTGNDQKLPNDVFLQVARDFLDDSIDVFALCMTRFSLRARLESEVFRTDILKAKHYADENDGLQHPFESLCDQLYVSWELPWTPFTGGFPDQSSGPYRDSSSDNNDDDEDLEPPPGSPRERMPPRRQLTILQWAALTGMVVTADKAIKVAKYTWSGYMDFPNPVILHAPVHLAAMYGHTEVLRLLATNGCAINAVSGYKCMPPRALREVFRHINPRLRFIPIGYDILDPDYPFALNALGLAILRGHLDAAIFLADYYDDAYVDHSDRQRVRNQDGSRPKHDYVVPPLHLAAFMGMVEVVKILLEKGADVNCTSPQIQDSSPLMWAVSRADNREIIDIFTQRGANVMHRDSQNRGALEWALQFEAALNARRLISEGVPFDVWLYSGRICCGLSLTVSNDEFWDCTKVIFDKYPNMSQGCLKSCVQDAIERCRGKNLHTLRWLIERDIGLEPFHEEDTNREERKAQRKQQEKDSFFGRINSFGITQEEGEALWERGISLEEADVICRHNQCTVSEVIQMKENGVDIKAEMRRIISEERDETSTSEDEMGVEEDEEEEEEEYDDGGVNDEIETGRRELAAMTLG